MKYNLEPTDIMNRFNLGEGIRVGFVCHSCVPGNGVMRGNITEIIDIDDHRNTSGNEVPCVRIDTYPNIGASRFHTACIDWLYDPSISDIELLGGG